MKTLNEACKAPVLVFDFDGVIVRGSESVKRSAWHKIVRELKGAGFQNVEHALKKAREIGKKSAGTRFDILKNFGKRLEVPQGELGVFVLEWAGRFDELVQVGITQTGIHDRDSAILRRLSKTRDLFVNSATPEKALRCSVSRLGIDRYFIGVYGDVGPGSKVLNLHRASKEIGVPPKEITFIGDSDGDYDAAQKFGCHFVGLSNDWNRWESDRPFPIIFDLSELIWNL